MDLRLGPGTSADVLILVPEVISLISKLGAMMVLIKAGFMSLCHSLEERMALCQPANNVTMTCTGGIGHALSSCLLGCGMHLLSTIQMTVGVAEFTAIALLCNVLCREGVLYNVVYFGGLSMRGQIWG